MSTLPGAGEIDHLAVGPAGAFVLDSKAWSGIVTVDQDAATITPRDAPDAALDCPWGAPCCYTDLTLLTTA